MKNFNASVEEIIQKVNILDIINNYVKLEKSGKNYFGICPFHEDTNPSMSVSPDKKIFKCFSCGAGGDAITFVQKIENISFPEALQKVASTVGIQIEVYQDPKEQINRKYYEIMQKASDFYKFSLLNLKDGQKALKYLYDRKLNNDIINRFNIGLSLNQSNLLYKALTKDNILAIDLIELGLVKSGQDYYDLFRNRIMFPLEDLNGNIVGFSGRTYLPNQSDHKYVNSPETIIFKKSNCLYNYHKAINDIKKQDSVFLFEGFMDVIAAYRADVLNAVASMGTALTDDQIRAIKKLTNNIVLCYDGDSAGQEATKRAIYSLASFKMNVKVVVLPDGLDPDDYINKYDEKSLKDFLEQKQISSLDFLYELERNKLIISDPSSIERFKNSIFNLLKKFNSHVLNEIYLNKMSEDLGVSVESLQGDFKVVPVYEPPKRHTLNKEVFPSQRNVKKYIRSEKFLIVMAYRTRDDCQKIINLLDNHYVIRSQRELLYKLYDYYQTNEVMDEELLKQRLTPEQVELISEILQNGTEEVINLTIEELVTNVKDYKSKEQVYLDNVKAIMNKEELSAEDFKMIVGSKKNVVKMLSNNKKIN